MVLEYTPKNGYWSKGPINLTDLNLTLSLNIHWPGGKQNTILTCKNFTSLM